MNKATSAALEWLQSDYDLRSMAHEITHGLISTGEGTLAVSHGLEAILRRAAQHTAVGNPFMTTLFFEGFRNINFSIVARSFIAAYERLIHRSS